MLRTQLYADPSGRFVHDVVLESCRKNGGKTALIDTSCNRRFTFAEYGSLVESLARGLISAGLIPGDVIAIFLRIRGNSPLLIMRLRWPEAFPLSSIPRTASERFVINWKTPAPFF